MSYSNVIRLVKPSEGAADQNKEIKTGYSSGELFDRWNDDFLPVAEKYGFVTYAVLDIAERRNGLVFPNLLDHAFAEELGKQIESIADLSNCSVFLMLSETNIPFPFTTGLDCRTNLTPDPDLLDNAIDGLLNQFGIRGGYCVPVCSPWGRRSLVMFFGRRVEGNSRYPDLVLDTIEAFDRIAVEGPPEFVSGAKKLTELEIDCLRALSAGKTLVNIASTVGLSEFAANLILEQVVAKMGAESRTAAAIRARDFGLI